MKVIDASRIPVGRLAAHVAKRLLAGEEIAIVNAEHAVVTGSKEHIIARYRHKLEVGGTKRKGPYMSRMPHLILKRTVRGMLPYQQPKGRAAYKRLKVHLGVPDEFRNAECETLDVQHSLRFMTLGELSTYLGGTWQK
jgi:large subunit ribosomal protein L13